MDPKLIRMYSNILNEQDWRNPATANQARADAAKGAGGQGARPSAPAVPAGAAVNKPAQTDYASNFALRNRPGFSPNIQTTKSAAGATVLPTNPNAPAYKMDPGQTKKVGTGASGFSTQKSPQGGRPTPTPADSMAARGKVDAMKGSQASDSQQNMTLGGRTGVTQSGATQTAAPTAPDTPSLDQQKAAAIGGSMQTGTAAGFAGQDSSKDQYDPDTDPTLAAGRTELAKAEPTNVAAPARMGGYAQSGTGAEGQGGTQAARPSSDGGVVGTRLAGDTNIGTRDYSTADMSPGNYMRQATTAFKEEKNEIDQEIEQGIEEELAEAFSSMLKLSGIPLNEKAVSQQQQKFMGMVHAMQKGEKVKGASPELKKVAKTMGKKDAKDFAATKHKGLPKKVTEGLNLMLDEEGHTLEHIVNRFKHEAKTFLNTGEMSDKLYDALYDYYLDRGDMPYGVAKAREGDPYTWVAARFEADIDGTVDVKMPMDEVAGDDTLNELAKLAGLSESRVDECDDMGMDTEDRLNVSTNMSSDGTKSVNISAQGEKAEELLSMLKLAGMGGLDRPAMVVVGNDEEMMDEERETQYANTPAEEYETVDRIIRQGNDLNREKKQFANMPKAGDNPMATDYMLDEELSALLDSVLVKEADPQRPKGDTGIADIYTADKGIAPPSPDEGPVGKTKSPAAPAAPKAPIAPGIKR